MNITIIEQIAKETGHSFENVARVCQQAKQGAGDVSIANWIGLGRMYVQDIRGCLKEKGAL